ncbi:MAG: SPOR domain-containing protein [Acidobacteria bacterium]|nr:SPOR domain-containing protein [Acidobacteriota bacterium]
MAEEPIHADSSHYEISLTAGQAFMAVLLLLGSIVASFVFGAIVGTARGEERAAGRTAQPLSSIEELDRSPIEPGAKEDHSAPSSAEPATRVDEPSSIVEDESPRPTVRTLPTSSPAGASPDRELSASPHDAQILSTTESAPAEALAARLIEAGFSSAYVARVPRDDSTLYRVRVRFEDEKSARDAVERLSAFAPGEVWVLRAD